MKRKLKDFINEINETIQNLDLDELKNIKARLAISTSIEAIEGLADDEEEIEGTVASFAIELYDTSSNTTIHTSRVYPSEVELLDETDDIMRTILKLLNEDKIHSEICFITQTFPFDLASINRYSSFAKMIVNYDKYVRKMTLGLSMGTVYTDKIDKKMSKIKRIFSLLVPPHWMNNNYKFDCHFKDDKCTVNVYRNDSLLDTYTS